MPKRKGKQRGQRYSKVEKQRILRIALKRNLTGAQVKQQFGVSPLTFYKWRGPVGRGRRRPASGQPPKSKVAVVRQATRAELKKLMPGILREEVAAYLANSLGTKKVRRRRRR